MQNWARLLLLSLVWTLALAKVDPLAPQPPAAKPTGDPPRSTKVQFREDQIIVVFKDGFQPPGLSRWATEKVGNGETVPQAIERMQRNPNVKYAEPDYIVNINEIAPDYTGMASTLWNMALVNATGAWNVSTGNEVKVCVIDTGIDHFHPDLYNNMDPIGRQGYNAITRTAGAMDDHGHGTHCSGVIAGVGNNGGLAGINWNSVKLMGCKFLSGSGSGSTSDAIICLDWCHKTMDAHISSNSWGGGGFSQALLDKINEVEAQGHMFVVAAGNDAVNIDSSPQYPCAYTTNNGLLTCVASTTSSDGMSSFSNYGATKVHIGAPGSSIYSSLPDSTYASWSGTSMATPHVAGAMALAKAVAGGEAFAPTVANQQAIRNAVLNNADPIAALAGKTTTGKRLNVGKAVWAADQLSALTGTLPTRTPVVPEKVKPDGQTLTINSYPITFANQNLTAGYPGDATSGQELAIHDDWANLCSGMSAKLKYPSYQKRVYNLAFNSAPTKGSITIDTCGAGVDTVLEVITCTSSNVCTCQVNDNGCGSGSSLGVTYTAGNTYRVIVHPAALQVKGTFPINVYDGAPVMTLTGAAMNISWSPYTATTTTLGTQGSTTAISAITASVCPTLLADRLVNTAYYKQVFEFKPLAPMVANSNMEINTCTRPSGTWDSVLGVLACNKAADNSLSNCVCYMDDDACGSLGSKITNVVYTTGKTYYAIVTSYNSGNSLANAGSYNLYVSGTMVNPVSPPSNPPPATCTKFPTGTKCSNGGQCCSGVCRKKVCT